MKKLLLLTAARGLVALAGGVWALLRRGGDGPDLGTVSGQ